MDRSWGNCLYGDNDIVDGLKMMNTRKTLQALSLVITALTLLYLLFANIYRQSFIFSDWVVVTVDLLAKTVIEIMLLRKVRA
jgi:hypothetical protein